MTPLATNAAACPTCGAEFDLFCPECNASIQPNEAVCLSCGHVFASKETRAVSELAVNAVVAHSLDNQLALEPEPFNAVCPACGMPVYREDGYCEACETSFCPHCGLLPDEDDEICPHCGRDLYLVCPLCEADLVAGTPVCPHCHALFPAYCAFCRSELAPEQVTCNRCGRDNPVIHRAPMRVLHTFLSGERPVYIIACPTCGTSFNPAETFCPTCQMAVCGECHTPLLADEDYCPRCGRAAGDKTPQATHQCPACGRAITLGDDTCAQCGQSLCPACGKGVSDKAIICPNCGTEFEFTCPACGETVDAAATTCPHCQTLL